MEIWCSDVAIAFYFERRTKIVKKNGAVKISSICNVDLLVVMKIL